MSAELSVEHDSSINTHRRTLGLENQLSFIRFSSNRLKLQARFVGLRTFVDKCKWLRFAFENAWTEINRKSIFHRILTTMKIQGFHSIFSLNFTLLHFAVCRCFNLWKFYNSINICSICETKIASSCNSFMWKNAAKSSFMWLTTIRGQFNLQEIFTSKHK